MWAYIAADVQNAADSFRVLARSIRYINGTQHRFVGRWICKSLARDWCRVLLWAESVARTTDRALRSWAVNLEHEIGRGRSSSVKGGVERPETHC